MLSTTSLAAEPRLWAEEYSVLAPLQTDSAIRYRAEIVAVSSLVGQNMGQFFVCNRNETPPMRADATAQYFHLLASEVDATMFADDIRDIFQMNYSNSSSKCDDESFIPLTKDQTTALISSAGVHYENHEIIASRREELYNLVIESLKSSE